MNEEKSRWNSRGFVAPLVSMLFAAAAMFGMDDVITSIPAVMDFAESVGITNQESAVNFVLMAAAATAAAVGSHGRLKATTKLK